MSTQERYQLPLDGLEWTVPSKFDSAFKWEYQDGSEPLHRLYEKGKKLQWNATNRIDWSQDLDPENPGGAARRGAVDLRLGRVEPDDRQGEALSCAAMIAGQ